MLSQQGSRAGSGLWMRLHGSGQLTAPGTANPQRGRSNAGHQPMLAGRQSTTSTEPEHGEQRALRRYITAVQPHSVSTALKLRWR